MFKRVRNKIEENRNSDGLFWKTLVSVKDVGWRAYDSFNNGSSFVYKFNPPTFPKKLPGSIWGITTFFNPAGYGNKRENYQKFRESSKKQGLKLLCVELAFGDKEFELNERDADILIQIRGNDKNIMWQKERLLNVGLENLPEDCDKIVWIDCDVLFDNKKWVKQTSKLLEKYVVVQPFESMVRLRKGEEKASVPDLCFGKEEGQTMHGMASGVVQFGRESLRNFFEHGHTGFAWAARREVFTKLGFYDRLIIGSGDFMMAHGFYGNKYNFTRGVSSLRMVGDQDGWIEKVFFLVRGSVYFTRGGVYHLWHGDIKDRFHVERFNLLKDNFFDPKKDIKLDENKCWMWATDKKKLHAGCQNYFEIRKEGV